MRADAEIVRETLAGKREAFSELVERHYPLIFGLALSSLRNRDDAEDAAQESFLRALKALNTLKEPARFASWLSSIVRNICRDFRARQSSEQHFAHLAAETPHEASEPDGNELHELLWEHVMALPPDEREILILYYFSKHNTRAIADLLSISVPAAEKRLQRARQSLGTRMEAALDETMESRGPASRAVERTVQAVVTAPVTWKTVTSVMATGLAGTSTSVIGSWKAIAVLAAFIALTVMLPLILDSRPDVAVRPTAETERATHDTPIEIGAAIQEPASVSPGTIKRRADIDAQDERPGVRVVDAKDMETPIQGALVTLITQNKSLRETTDANGIARFDVVPSEGVRMKLQHAEYFPRRDVPAEFEKDSLQTVTLDRSGGLRGRVIDAKTQAPVTSFKLFIVGKYGEVAQKWEMGSGRQINDTGGRFEVEGIKKGSMIVTAFGYSSKFISVDSSDGEIEIPLGPDYTLDVTVTDGMGRPVDGVDILSAGTFDSTEDDFHAESGRTICGTTNSNGKARIEHVVQRPYDIAIRDPRFVPLNYTIDQNLEGPVIPVSLVVDQPGGVEGVIRYGGSPVPGITISLSLRGIEPEYKLQKRFDTEASSEGKFQFESVPSGLYRYSVHTSDDEWSANDIPSIDGELTVTPGTTTRQDIVIPIGTASISGHVRRGSAPLANARVAIGTESGRISYFRTARTSSDGSYAIDALLPGQADIYFSYSIAFEDEPAENQGGQSLRRHHRVELAAGRNTAFDADFPADTLLIASVIAPEDTKSSIDIAPALSNQAAPNSSRENIAGAQCLGSRELRFESLDAGTYEISIDMFSKTVPHRSGTVLVEIPSNGTAEIELNWESLQPSEQ